jgi:predicted nuclease of predicted toxin-antitoxin system
LHLLADENIFGELVRALRSSGHDVAWIYEDARGSDDISVLTRARSERRLLLTFDTDFGDLIFRDHLPPPPGLVLLRISSSVRRARVAELISAALASRDDWEGAFSVIDERRIRNTPLQPDDPRGMSG